MKKYIIIALFLITTNILSQSKGEVIYEIKYNLTLEKINERVKKMKTKPNKNLIESLKARLKNSRNLEGKLTFSNMISNYELIDKVSNEGKNISSTLLKNSTGGDNLYYTSIKKQKCLIQDCKTLDECFVIEKEKVEWYLTQDTKNINGYKCYKAINTNSKNKIKKTIAWYTNEIPLGYGPKAYSGLPGLVLEIEEAAILYRAKKITFNPKKEIVLKKPKGKKITEENFKKLLLKSFPELYRKK